MSSCMYPNWRRYSYFFSRALFTCLLLSIVVEIPSFLLFGSMKEVEMLPCAGSLPGFKYEGDNSIGAKMLRERLLPFLTQSDVLRGATVALALCLVVFLLTYIFGV